MAKELPYFKFEISEWMLGRIQKQPLEVQGIFINLCCKYWHKLGELTVVDARLDFDDGPINALLEKGIIGTDGEYIYIKFLDLQLDECNELSKKNSINGLKSAKIRAERKRSLTTVEPSLEVVQRVSTEEKRREERRREDKIRESKHSIENSSSTPTPAGVSEKTLDFRKEEFKAIVNATGGDKYTKQMLDDFFSYWSEPNRAKKPKMRFELEKTWDMTRRMTTWAGKQRGYVCLLTESQKTIANRRHEFAVSLEAHLPKYGKEMLNSFYQYWSQPENKPEPMKLRYQEEEFWDVGQRLVQWASKNAQDQSKPQVAHRHA